MGRLTSLVILGSAALLLSTETLACSPSCVVETYFDAYFEGNHEQMYELQATARRIDRSEYLAKQSAERDGVPEYYIDFFRDNTKIKIQDVDEEKDTAKVLFTRTEPDIFTAWRAWREMGNTTTTEQGMKKLIESMRDNGFKNTDQVIEFFLVEEGNQWKIARTNPEKF